MGNGVNGTATSLTTGGLAGPIPAATTEKTPPNNNNNSANIASSTASAHENSNNLANNGFITSNTNNTNSNNEAGNNRHSTPAGSSSNPATTGDKIDTRPSEEWSDQFRDRRLMEDNIRRRVLLRQLLSPDAASDKEYPEGGEDAGAGAGVGGKRNGGSFRKKSGQGKRVQHLYTV